MAPLRSYLSPLTTHLLTARSADSLAVAHSCRARPERQVRNPATGESVTKAADKQVKFTIAKALKDSVNG